MIKGVLIFILVAKGSGAWLKLREAIAPGLITRPFKQLVELTPSLPLIATTLVFKILSAVNVATPLVATFTFPERLELTAVVQLESE